MKCEFSNKTKIVGDYESIVREAKCPACSLKVKITIPDRKMHGNTAKFKPHSKPAVPIK